MGLPFFSPYPRAKLYTRFVFEKQITLQGEPVELQFANFVTHDTFKWVPSHIDKGAGIAGGRLLVEANSIEVLTNFRGEIKQNDIVGLKHPAFPRGQYFVVSAPIRIADMTFPSPSMDLKLVTLQSLNLDEVNIKNIWLNEEDSEK